MSRMKIAIDAGHGILTPGKRCLRSLDENQTREWTLNSRVAARVAEHLERCGAQVLRTDDTSGQTDVALSQRAEKANRWGADLLVSIHHNAGANGTASGGPMVFVYARKHSPVSDQLQESVYRNLVEAVGAFGNRSQPLAAANFAILRQTSMPAVLVEVGFMDSLVDTPMILNADFAARAAQGIAKGICETAGLSWWETEESRSYLVRVTVDCLNVRQDPSAASEINTRVTRGEVFTIVEEFNNDGTIWGRLKSGAGWIALRYTEGI